MKIETGQPLLITNEFMGFVRCYYRDVNVNFYPDDLAFVYSITNRRYVVKATYLFQVDYRVIRNMRKAYLEQKEKSY